MQEHRDKREHCEFDTKGFNLHEAGSQGWHYGFEGNFVSENVLSRNTLSVTSPNQLHSLFGGPNSDSGSIYFRKHFLIFFVIP